MQKKTVCSNKKINILLLGSLIFSTISSPLLAATQPEQTPNAAQEAHLFQTIANSYLKSFDMMPAPKPEVTLEDLAKNNEKVAVQKIELSEAEKRHLAFTMLADQSVYKDTFVGPVIDKTFLNKMEVLAGGENSKNSLFNQINRTETVFGEAALARWLTQPLTDIKALEERQKMIQELIQNEELFNTLDAYVKQIKQVQSQAFLYWQKDNKVNEELYKKLFFGSWFDGLNKSSTALEAGTRFDNFVKILILLDAQAFLGMTLGLAISRYTLQEKLGAIDPKFKNTSVSKAVLEGAKDAANNMLSLFKYIFDQRNKLNNKAIPFLDNKIEALEHKYPSPNNVIAAQLNDLRMLKIEFEKNKGNAQFWRLAYDKGVTPNTIYKNLYLVETENLRDFAAYVDATYNPEKDMLSPFAKKALMGCGIAMYLGTKAYTTKQLADEEILRQSAANNIHAQMIGVATYVEAMKKMQTTLAVNPAFAALSTAPAFAQLSGSAASVSHNFNSLLGLLDHNTFKGSPSFFSLTGRVLAAHQIMKEVKNEMVPAFELAGELDAYLSVAKLYKEFADKRVQYSFAQYMTADKPYFKVEGFWNPMVNHHVVVANDFALGSDTKHPANALVTGPNTGGKSTVLKGILLNLLLAQTLTITPAQNLTFTPYTKINCYLNVTDDIGAGTSLFKAEVLRAKALINAIRGLTQGQFSFTIMDEMFSGTSPKEGEEAAYMFAEQLGEFDASMLLIATHFPLLTHLEDKTTRFKNYQVTVIKDENGKLHRPYKLEEGKSFLNIAMDLLKEEGVL